jgi:hypothetical protein
MREPLQDPFYIVNYILRIAKFYNPGKRIVGRWCVVVNLSLSYSNQPTHSMYGTLSVKKIAANPFFWTELSDRNSRRRLFPSEVIT